MVLTGLSRFLALLLTIASFVVVLILLLSGTVLSSTYLDARLVSSDAYKKLATALPNQIIENIDKDENQSQNQQQITGAMNGNPMMPQSLTAEQLQIKAAEKAKQLATLKQVLTESVIRDKVATTLSQFEKFIKSGGPAPTLDLSDVIARARAQGLPVPEDAGLNKPISLGDDLQDKNISDKYKTVKAASLATFGALLLLLLVVAWRRKRYAVFPDIVMAVGVLLGLVAAAFAFAPSIVEKAIKLDLSSNAFATIAHDTLLNVASDLSQRIGIVAAVIFVIGLAARILMGKFAPHLVRPPKPNKFRRLQ